MEPNCVARIDIHCIAGHHKGLTVGQLDRCTIRLTGGTDDGVVGHNKISGSTLQVDSTSISAERIVVQSNRAACALRHKRILCTGRRMERTVFDGHIHIKVLIAVQIAIESAAIKFIGRGVQCALIGAGRHILDPIKSNVSALESRVGTIRNVPPVVGQCERTVDCAQIKGGCAVAANNIDLRDVTSLTKPVSCTAKGEHTGIRHLLVAINRPRDLTAVCKECMERILAQRLFCKAAVGNQHRLDRFICILNGVIRLRYTSHAADGYTLPKFILSGIRIILVVEAVALHGVLRGHHSDGDAVDGLVHVLIAGRLLHVALDGEGIALTGRQMLLGAHRHIADGPLDDLVQLSAAVDAGDSHLVLQGQIAVVDDTQLRQGIGAARLPQNLLARSSLDEVQRLALGADPLAAGILHFQRHIQIPRLDLIDPGGCGVGEPRKGGADKHCHAHNDSQCAGNQCPLGRFAACHCVLPPYSIFFNDNM